MTFDERSFKRSLAFAGLLGAVRSICADRYELGDAYQMRSLRESLAKCEEELAALDAANDAPQEPMS